MPEFGGRSVLRRDGGVTCGACEVGGLIASWLLLLRSSELPRLPLGVFEFLSVWSSDTGRNSQFSLLSW